MAEISKITLPSGTTYDLKDATARSQIAALSNYTAFAGVTTTALTDGSTTSTIVVGGNDVTAQTGMIATYGSKEFVWNGSAWQEFGDLSALGNLAYSDTASASYTPAGSVSSTFSGTEGNVSVSGTTTGSVSNGEWTHTNIIWLKGTCTPSGSVSLTGTTNKTATVSPASSGTATYTPAGSITGTTFTGASMTSTGTFTPAGSVSLTNTNQTATVSPADSGAATYTPAGSITAGAITVKTAGATGTIHNPTKVTVAKTVVAAAPGATAPSNALTYYSVANETLSLYQLGYTTGDSITTSDVTVKTGDAAYESANPTFSGTGVRLVTGNISVPSSASFSGTEGNVSVSGTTTGSVSNGTFSGTGVRLVTGNIAVPSSASFSGTEGSVTFDTETSSTASGESPALPSGTGWKALPRVAGEITGTTFTGAAMTSTGTFTPSGSVSSTFSGTAATIQVSPDE